MTVTNAPKISAIMPWFGSKRSLAPIIVGECCSPEGQPPKSFWDLACGSFAVSLAMPRCAHHHAVDIHGDLLNLARIIRDPVEGPLLYRRLRRVVNHEGIFDDAKAVMLAEKVGDGGVGLFTPSPVELSPLDRATLYFIISWQGRNGVSGTRRVNYQPAVRWTSGGGHGAVRFRNAVDSLPAWRRRLRDITIIERDLFVVLAKIDDQEGTTIYIDPPYVRDGEGRSGSCAYEHEFTPRQHHRLAESLGRFDKARVVISYYDCAEVRSLYGGWTFVECARQKNLHTQNRRGAGAKTAPEVLIINGPSYTGAAA